MLLTLFGIVIGVAASVAITINVRAARAAYADMFEAVAGRAALEVVADGFGGFDESVISLVESAPAVKAAVPVIQTPAAIIGPGGAVPVMVLGVDPVRDAAARDYVLQQGRGINAGDEILLEVGFAEANRLDLGKPARLLTTSGFATLPVVGLLKPRGMSVPFLKSAEAAAEKAKVGW
jgi:ABC-type lipoprotein release transport system permease subunit